MSDAGKKLTKAQIGLLTRGVEFASLGGFWNDDRRKEAVAERLRKRGLLKFWNGKRAIFPNGQFYDITEAGRAAINDGGAK